MLFLNYFLFLKNIFIFLFFFKINIKRIIKNKKIFNPNYLFIYLLIYLLKFQNATFSEIKLPINEYKKTFLSSNNQ